MSKSDVYLINQNTKAAAPEATAVALETNFNAIKNAVAANELPVRVAGPRHAAIA